MKQTAIQMTTPKTGNRPYSEVFKTYFELRKAKQQVFFNETDYLFYVTGGSGKPEQTWKWLIKFKDGSKVLCVMSSQYRSTHLKTCAVFDLIYSIAPYGACLHKDLWKRG